MVSAIQTKPAPEWAGLHLHDLDLEMDFYSRRAAGRNRVSGAAAKQRTGFRIGGLASRCLGTRSGCSGDTGRCWDTLLLHETTPGCGLICCDRDPSPGARDFSIEE